MSKTLEELAESTAVTLTLVRQGEEIIRLRHQLDLAKAWLEAEDAWDELFPNQPPRALAAQYKREAFRASLKGEK